MSTIPENTQLALIQRGIRLLFKQGQLVELRIRTANDTWRGVYYDDHAKLSDTVLRLDSDERVVSLYYVINAVRPNLPKERGITVNPTAAQVNVIVDGPTQQLTSNNDIENFNWLFIDVDTTRMPELAGIPERKEEFSKIQHEPSTNAEKANSRKTAVAVLKHLDEKGWPQPLLGDSGNGWHILFRVNLLNTAHNKNLLVDDLKALAAKFNGPNAKIDAAVFNPARLTRAYGTTTRKGTSTDERPYRLNSLIEPTVPINEVSLSLILNLINDSMISGTRRDDDDLPELAEGFEPMDWIEHYANQGAWDIDGERDVSGKRVVVTDICPIAGHKHTGSSATGFIIGDTFGFHCFSDDCEGGTIGTIFRWLKEQKNTDGTPKFKPYGKPIFVEDSSLEEMLEDGDIVEAEEEDKKAVVAEEKRIDDAMIHTPETKPQEEPEPSSPAKNNWQTGSDAIDELDERCRDLATYMMGVIVHHPDEVYNDGFIHFRKRLKEKLGYDAKPRKIPKGEVGHQTLPIGPYETMRMIIKFVEAHRRLPDKAALKHFVDVATDPEVRQNEFKKDIHEFIDELRDNPISTFDQTVISLVNNLDLRQEVRAWRASFSYHLLSRESIQDARDALKKHFNLSTTQDTNFEQGAWQERTDVVYEDFQKNVLGSSDAHKFRTGLISIDTGGLNIGLDGSRAICLCGPASNRKTTLALSVALNFGIDGKNVLFCAGEHMPRKVLKKLTLQLSHFFRDKEEYPEWYDEEIAKIPALQKWEGLNRTATLGDLAAMKKLLDKLKGENLVPGYIEPQGVDGIARGAEDKVQAILDYAEATYLKYQWDAVIIDPLDTIMPPEVAGKANNNWKLCSGIVDRLFDFSRNAFGGRGCLVIVTAQFGADARREIERLQEKNTEGDNYDDEIESILKRDGLIQYFTTIGQRFDLALGVATRTKDGNEGLVVKGRDREGGSFGSLSFRIDPETNYLREVPREYKVLEEKPRTLSMSAGSYDEAL